VRAGCERPRERRRSASAPAGANRRSGVEWEGGSQAAVSKSP
jgi:hypothetical protein